MERSWTEKQKQILKLKIQDSMLKKQRANDFIDVILKKCKEHGGPVTSISELNQLCLKYNDNDIKKYLRQEIQYQKAAHRRDSQERPGLYKINNLTSEELTEQIALLLATDSGEARIRKLVLPSGMKDLRKGILKISFCSQTVLAAKHLPKSSEITSC